ncbi:TRAP transporter small permease [Kushneria phosphatilytica]|nr:TRAP transporter small permease [Kushneria phosphatilytica]
MSNGLSDKRGFIGGVEKGLEYMRKFLLVIVGLLTIAVFFCVTANVFGRFVLNSSYPWAEEMSRFFFIWTVLLGAGVACLGNENVTLEFVRERVPAIVGKLFDLIRIAVIYAICIVIFLAWQDVLAGFVSFTPILGIPHTWMFVAMLVFAVLMFLANTLDLLRLGAGLKKEH